MGGLNLVKKEESIMSVVSNIGVFSLKAKDDRLEVVHIEAKAGKGLFLHPYECEEALYLFYILEGKIFYRKNKTYLSSGDCITAKNLTETEYFDIQEDVKMLMMTQKDFFDFQVDFAVKMSQEIQKIQEKDQYTEEHCNRTGNLAFQMGMILNLESDALNDLMFASKIHDLGKVNVPLEILNKPGFYTVEEFDIMKKHSEDGYNIIKDNVNEKIALIVKEHHEKYNVSGYPDGLTNNEVLIESRILAVADAYDALLSDRPYRRALTKEEVFTILERDRDILWDGFVLDALYKIEGI